MELTKLRIEDLTPHPRNYNTHPEEQLVELEKSLDEFDQYKNIVVCQGVIIAGHGLVEAAKRKGMTEIYALVRDDMTEEQQLALLVADNATPAGAFPDVGKLNSIFENIEPFTVPGITQEWLDSVNTQYQKEEEKDNTYTKKIEAPIYEPKNEKPNIEDLVDTKKTQELIEEIESSSLPEHEKQFLRQAATRHTIFDYQKIADFYAHSSKEVQELMEDSALVIIDFKKAIEHGYVKLSEEITNQYLEDYPNES